MVCNDVGCGKPLAKRFQIEPAPEPTPSPEPIEEPTPTPTEEPAPTPSQFTVNVANADGSTGTVSVSSVSVSGNVVTLELASALSAGQMVTLDYAHDASAPLQRAGGGDSAPGFTGQEAKNDTLLGGEFIPQNFEVITRWDSLNLFARWDLSVRWDALDEDAFYKLAWRRPEGDFEPGNAATDTISSVPLITASNPGTVTITSDDFTVSDHGNWLVRLQVCNDVGCGPEAVLQVAVPAPNGLHVAIVANPPDPLVNEWVSVSADISNLPSGYDPSYLHQEWRWFDDGNGSEWEYSSSGGGDIGYQKGNVGSSVTVWAWVSYHGRSATSDRLTITWAEPPPNRAPAVDEQAGHYQDFVGKGRAPRGSGVSVNGAVVILERNDPGCSEIEASSAHAMIVPQTVSLASADQRRVRP